MKGTDIREEFLKYFSGKDHTIVKSSSLVPENDPTLLFANAGMNQFKESFLGTEKRSYSRACSCQKVVRAGGKHNDLENVGRTARHHTFFEMLGNFSFGDYFKREAIEFGWEFLTEIIGLDKEKLYVSVFHEDDDAYSIWKDEINVPEERILRLGEKENFWSMGDTGPCGPCSEIHIDQGEKIGCGKNDCDPECDCDRFLELWNLVFMQYNRDENGKLSPLPKPSIDTGLGLERIAAVSQNVQSNFDTDLIKPIIEKTANIAGIKYNDSESDDISLRVIADHARAVTFLIADGVIPANEGRGYVLKRIMRRAMRHGRMLGIIDNFFNEVCEFVNTFMSDHYVELADKREYISKIVLQEEKRFKNTLTTGLKIIDSLFKKYGYEKMIPGKEVFTLYDTYGFPVDLFEDIAVENNFTLDMKGFDVEMSKQQEKAKQAWKGSGDKKVDEKYKTMSSKYSTKFTGYDSLEINTRVVAVSDDNSEIEKASAAGDYKLILEETPFYPEGGGQAGDTGVIENEDFVFEVENTLQYGENFIVHEGRLTKGSLECNMNARAKVDHTKRKATEKNHTSTHILHAKLIDIIGDHVRQSGSLVDDTRLRFDFTHFAPVSKHEIDEIETEINRVIQRNLKVHKEITDMETAIKNGAMAIFGEKYGESVRVVSVDGVTKELCGGCHVERTGEIGVFKIVSESSVASGIRRIEAVTGMGAFQALSHRYSAISELALMLKTGQGDVKYTVENCLEKIKSQEKEINSLKEKLYSDETDKMLKNVEEYNGVNILILRMDNQDIPALRKTVDMAKAKMKSGIVLIGSENEGKAVFLCGVTKDLTGRYKAGDIVKETAAVCGGGGGGKPDMAQAGAKDARNIDKALTVLYDLI